MDVTREQAKATALIGTSLALASVVAYAMTLVVDPLFVFGGMDCETTKSGVNACFGYAPAGLAVSGIVSAVVVGGSAALLGKRSG